MASEPERISNQIEMTRASLAANVDELADRTSPNRVIRRGWHRFTDKMHGVSDTVMGKPAEMAGSMKDSVREMAGQTSEKVSEVAGDAADAVRQAPHMAAEQTRGNPLAAGLIAFGAGMLAAALIPESDLERRMSRKLADSDLVEQAREPLMESAGQVREDVTEAVKDSAGQVGQSVKEHAMQAKDEAKESVTQR